MNDILTERRAQIADLCRKYRVQRLAAFGSVLREDFDPDRSDIDFIVEFAGSEDVADGYFDLRNDLMELFSRKVDLVSWRSVRNPYFRHEVERSQELLYAA